MTDEKKPEPTEAEAQAAFEAFVKAELAALEAAEREYSAALMTAKTGADGRVEVMPWDVLLACHRNHFKLEALLTVITMTGLSLGGTPVMILVNQQLIARYRDETKRLGEVRIARGVARAMRNKS